MNSLDTSSSHGAWRPVLLLCAAFILVTTWNLGLQTVENPDEPRYAVPSRLMIEGGSWIVPEFNGEARLAKPIFFYWLISLTAKAGAVLGLELSLGMRVGSLLMGLFGVLGTYTLGKRLISVRAGLIAAGILMTTKLHHELSRMLITDMTLSAFLTWAWVFALLGLDRLREKRSAVLPLVGFYLCCSGACMTKGPLLVALFVVLPLIVFLAWSKRLGEIKRVGLWWGIPLALAPNIWWTWELWKLGYHDEVRGYYMLANAGRAVSTDVDHYRPMPIIPYITTMGEWLAPWSLALPGVIYWTIQRWRKSAQNTPVTSDDTRRLLICAIAIPFIALGLSVSKRYLYLLPMYPWLALWIALAWEKTFLSDETKPARYWPAIPFGLGFLFAGAAVAAYLLRDKWLAQSTELLWMSVIGTCCVLGLSSCGMQAARGRRVLASLQLIVVAGLLMIGYESLYRPLEERRENRKEFFSEVAKRLNGRELVMVGESSNEAVWYLRPKVRLDNVPVAELKEHFFDKPGLALLIRERDLARFPKLKDAVIPEAVLRRNARDSWLLVHAHPENKPDPSLFERRRTLSKGDSPD